MYHLFLKQNKNKNCNTRACYDSIMLYMQISMSVPVAMEDVNKTVTTSLGATPAHATLDMPVVDSMDAPVYSLVS